MGFTYAVQVPVGQELKVKIMIENMLKRFGNPGIIAVHALETFTQTLNEKGLSVRHWKAKLPGYIFVTIANTERISADQGGNCSAGLGMEASSWQLIKRIPLVRKILNRYIQHDEWKNFFDNVDLEPEIEVIEKNLTIELTELAENKHEEHSLVTLLDQVSEAIEENDENENDSTVVALHKIISVVQGSKAIYSIPYKLYKSLINSFRKRGGSITKLISVQNVLHALSTLTKKVVNACKA